MDISLGRVQKTQPHLFSDAIEILCAYGNESPISETSAYSLLLNSVSPAEESVDEETSDIDDDNFDDRIDGAERNSKLQQYVEECFRHLEFRVAAFGENYPFHMKDGAIFVKKNISDHHKLYLILLASARCRSFGSVSGMKQKLADFFEEICLICLKKMLPEGSDVVGFGPNSPDRRNRFGTNLLHALPSLAEMMGIDLASGWQKNMSSSGDAGIDLVGAQKLDEWQGGWNVFLAQCAAHEEAESWQKKRAEANLSFYHYLFSYSVLPQAVLFIPGCFRQADGSWANRRYTDGVILMDRLRLMRIAAEYECLPDSVGTFFGANLEV